MSQFTGRYSGQAAAGKNAVKQKVAPQTTGAKIMHLADMIHPALMKKLQGCRDENGMPVQPARVRGLSLIIAQNLIKAQETKAG